MGLGYVALFSSNVPLWDDFWLVPPVSGESPPTWEWCWAQDAAHRWPVVKLAMFVLIKATGNDFRAVTWLNFLLVGASSLLFLLAVWRVRGRAAYVDAVVPLALLHWGAAPSLLHPAVLALALYQAACALILFLLARLPGPGGGRAWTWIAAACLLLALDNTAGILLAIPVASWVLWRRLRGTGPGAPVPAAAVAFAASALVTGLVILALYRRPEAIPAPTSLPAVLRTALQALGRAFGSVATVGWKEHPNFGYGLPVFTLLAAALALLAALLLARVARAEGPRRLLAQGLLAVLVGLLLEAGGIGVTRSGLAPVFGLQNHYILYMAPLLVLGHLAAEIGLRPGRRRFVQTALFTLVASLFLVQAERGFRAGQEIRLAVREFEDDAKAGMSVEALARKHTPFVMPSREELEIQLGRMRRAGMHPFEGR